ncbi:DAK2 domain-containing protein [Streptomyces zingiberis]|uniref:DAK2 domain-containing protein n=2 Tax=Streptomyces zingiberis TaxID=2053010 RepID=A0ABX1C147_9ACTN|nr:DAK2 domain-containing protein [Streptomyces zingiberis]
MVRAWCGLALEALGKAREDIDAINVYPVADGDTGTNLYFTVESAARAVEAVFTAHEAGDQAGPERDGAGGGDGSDGVGAPGGLPSPAEALRAMTHGALIGARGNSGTILAQMLRGLAEVLAEPGDPGAQGTQDSRGAEDARHTGDVREAKGAGGPERGGAPGAGPVPGGAGTAGAPAHDGTAGTAGTAGAAEGAAPAGDAGRDPSGERLRRALRSAGDAAYRAVAHPVEGTMLTVAAAAADAAGAAPGGPAEVVRAAYAGACAALEATPGQLDVLGRAGVVDAGGCGLVAVVGALLEAVTGEAPRPPGGSSRERPVRYPPEAGTAEEPAAPAGGRPCAAGEAGAGDGPVTAPAGPAFEVMYLLEAGDAAVEALRRRLDPLGDSLVVVGGDGLWNVHVHVDDAGAAVEAGIEAGRPHRVRISHLGAGRTEQPPRAARAVVAVLPGDGLAELCREAGAVVVTVRPGEPPAAGELVQAVWRAHAREVVLLPNDAGLRHTAAAAAEQARAEGIRVAVIPARSCVQGLAALAVHQPERRFDEDVVAMTAAAGATRHAHLTVAEHRSWTMAGVCRAGDVLGLIDGEVAVIGEDLATTAEALLDRMLAAGGELVTLVLGADAPETLAGRLEERVRRGHLAVDTVVYHGGQPSVPLIIGVE